MTVGHDAPSDLCFVKAPLHVVGAGTEREEYVADAGHDPTRRGQVRITSTFTGPPVAVPGTQDREADQREHAAGQHAEQAQAQRRRAPRLDFRRPRRRAHRGDAQHR